MRSTTDRGRSKVKIRLLRIVAALLIGAAGGTAVAATPAAADDGFTGTFVIWGTGHGDRCIVPNSPSFGSHIVSWSGCPGNNFPDMWWQSNSLGNGYYQLKNNHWWNMCIAAPNNSKNAKAIVTSCDANNTRQQWEELTDPVYGQWGSRMLRNRYSGYCLVPQGTTGSSDPIVQWDCAPWFADQWWYFHTNH